MFSAQLTKGTVPLHCAFTTNLDDRLVDVIILSRPCLNFSASDSSRESSHSTGRHIVSLLPTSTEGDKYLLSLCRMAEFYSTRGLGKS